MTTIDVAPECKKLIKLAAKQLKGPERRSFMAQVAEDLCFSSSRLTESEFGFGRDTVKLGMHEKRSGLVCYGDFVSSGRQKSEVVYPHLEEDIRSLVDPQSQSDPQLRNTFSYTRITAKAVRQQLIDEKDWEEDKLPTVRTFNNILKRMGYKLRKVEKTKPQKKSRKPMTSLKTSAKSGKKSADETISCKSA